MDYTITRAAAEHLPALPEIERQAAALFEGLDFPLEVLQQTASLADLRTAMQSGHLWVALGPDGQPVGFAQAEPSGEDLHLEELDVMPAHGRRGLGRRLVDAVCACAREEGFAAVTLTTYRTPPWNAPFYERLGFSIVLPDALTPAQQARVAQEARRGLSPHLRVVMRRRA